jgi:hypothetical protein
MACKLQASILKSGEFYLLSGARDQTGVAAGEEAVAAQALRRWLGLALLALVLAGIFALAVVVGRMPPFDRYVTDPLFFKRCLVAHVNLALVTWFYSFLAALLFGLPGRGRGWAAEKSVYLAAGGIGMMMLGAAMPAGQPVLSNYIPTIDNGPFKLGQLAFFAGVLLSFLDRGLLRDGGRRGLLELSGAARSGLRAAAGAFGLATLTFAIAYLKQPVAIDLEVQYELLVWGGGHVLQLVCTIAMVTLWLILLEQVLGAPPVTRAAARGVFFAMLLPWTLSPLLALQGTWTAAYRSGFTSLMQWCIFPGVCAFLILCSRSLYRAWRAKRIGKRVLADYRVAAFLVSGVLALLGFGLGAAIRGSNTMVPAHYHASVGAVTVSFMAGTFMLLSALRLSIPTLRLRRAAAWQPFLYGTGMLVFASGFALAGAHGMGRKVYGAEQAARGLAETIGLGMMGVGGLVSISGGLLFLGVVAAAWWRGVESGSQPVAELEKGSGRWRLGT